MSQNSLVLDSNLLLLLCIGIWRPEQISEFKRTSKYERSDFDLLVRFLSRYPHILVTPNIVTETSNLLGQLKGEYRVEALNVLQRLLAKREFGEEYVSSIGAMQGSLFLSLGVTDACIEQLARSGNAVISDDFPLIGRLRSAGLNAVNFAHLQSGNWTLG